MAEVAIARPFRAGDSSVWSPRTSRRWAMAAVIFGVTDAVAGLAAKAGIVAAGS
jgi:hypothetical protein